MGRSILVAEIYIKATEARIGGRDDGAALNLMSTDIERVSHGLLHLHDIWASVIQVSLAGWMLYNQLGAAFVAPMVVVIVCCVGLAILMKFTGDSQRAWMAAVQKRVSLTAKVVASMKNVKMSGLLGPVSDMVQKLRVEDLAAGSRFRKIVIIAALFGYIPLMISPALTFAFSQRTLDATRMFTSLSYLFLLTNPLSRIFQDIPQLLSALACLSRIQAYLERETHHDFREVIGSITVKSEKNEPDGATALDLDAQSAYPVVIENVVVGPVGSGKSTLCKALLGEIPLSQGNIFMSKSFPHVGFCDQTAFLSNGSIRDNIIAFSQFNSERYAEVIEATALNLDFETFPEADITNIGSDGITLSGGQKQRVSIARALYLQSDLLVLDDIFSGLDANTEEHVFRQVFGPDGLLRRRRSTVVLCTHSVRHLPVADYIIALGDNTVAEQGSFEELMVSEGYVRRMGLAGASDSDASSDMTVSKNGGQDSTLHLTNITATNKISLAPDTDESRQLGDKTVYKHYMKSMGFLLALFCLFSASLWGFFTNFPTIWLTYWSDDVHSEHPVRPYAYYAGIYALLQIYGLISLLLLAIAIFVFSVRKAGANLHRDALHTLVRAPLRFFTTTDTGVVTNLFSQDLNLIDIELPNALWSTLISFYLRTSRQMRLIDLEAKSSLYTHFLDTVKGVTTLRAFGFIRDDIQKNARLVDFSQRPAYLLIMIQQWLNLVLDLVVMALAAILTTLAVQLHTNSGFTGASLVTLMNFGESLSGIVMYYTRLETSIGAIARLKTFNKKVKPEDRDEEDIILPENWPQSGVIELKGVSASYDEQDQADETPSLALRNISLNIKSGEKVAICGRTGSGKSSLIALLLKLLDPLPETEGNVAIDNMPLHHINRSALRQRILAVPQEAVFLPDGSSFQSNLDPFNASTPEECQKVLEAVDMWKFVQHRGGLDAGMSTGTLSAGQRQLFSLARVLLRQRIRAQNVGLGGGGLDGGVLLLDEVSSNVDFETERSMQETIRNELRGYTVVAVSHRLDMIMDFDRVVVMDAGEIVEVGNPAMLAEDAGTRFGALVRAGGK
ncbi:hypothetical protein AJ79_03906 [Helicocarpus griseus UAMH5409]|uniref:Uncharacterized protein n=1 Tax=Helicocarpus griseus UAMH5409 TaxID=1447875 RepID=A0A2B7XVT6_9EURO|nr:hypothetical protein AJ79_03906 [Helicocarpus griseus UAMH5409]